jgi:hypothetical protein
MLSVPNSQLFMVSPPSGVKKESFLSTFKEGNDSSENGESLVIGDLTIFPNFFSPLFHFEDTKLFQILHGSVFKKQ